jgi:hypothetical protein
MVTWKRYRWLRIFDLENLIKLGVLFLILGSVTPVTLRCHWLHPTTASASDDYSPRNLYDGNRQPTSSPTTEKILRPSVHGLTSRRHWMQLTTAVASAVVVTSSRPTKAIASEQNKNALPSFLRDYTKLGPLGNKQVFNHKTTGLSLAQIASRLTNDLLNGAHGKGGYFLTGDLSTDLFRDDCVFEDPTNRVASLSQYQKALTVLFDPERSNIEIVEPLQVNEFKNTISGRLRSRGYLKLPWNPHISTYETTVTYTVDPETGLIVRQDQTWSKAASQALRESFTPSLVSPPPASTCGAKSDEPAAVTKLFNVLNGRHPNEYTAEERTEIDALVDEIVNGQARAQWSTASKNLSGTWILVYLQPGPGGAGIDRRIPFPDFDFNDNYQVFSIDPSTTGRVTNIGQMLGPLVNVQVAGTLQESSPSSPFQRYEANIEGGKMCFASKEPAVNCWIDLPMIKGQGLFDSLYLGDRLRIGQNLNGGGARVVQLRLQ